MALKTIIDHNLRDGYAQLKPGTMLHANQLMAAQVRDASLRTQGFYVADGPLYSLEGTKKTPTLWLTREPDNLVLRHLNDEVNSSYEQLLSKKTGHNFRPDLQEAQQAMRAEDTLRIDLTKLDLNGNDLEWRYVEISTSDYKRQLNAEEQKLAERYFGQRNDFKENMKMLGEAGISATRVYVVNPAYVQQEAQEGPIGRASRLSYFYGYSGAGAVALAVGVGVALRGVRREASVSEPVEGMRPKGAGAENGIIAHYDALLTHPQEAVAALDAQRAAGLAGLLQTYLSTRGQ